MNYYPHDQKDCANWCIMCRKRGCRTCCPKIDVYTVEDGGYGGWTRFCKECAEAVHSAVEKRKKEILYQKIQAMKSEMPPYIADAHKPKGHPFTKLP